jgi:hypothetical protein
LHRSYRDLGAARDSAGGEAERVVSAVVERDRSLAAASSDRIGSLARDETKVTWPGSVSSSHPRSGTAKPTIQISPRTLGSVFLALQTATANECICRRRGWCSPESAPRLPSKQKSFAG